jgi:hypothetical protein
MIQAILLLQGGEDKQPCFQAIYCRGRGRLLHCQKGSKFEGEISLLSFVLHRCMLMRQKKAHAAQS